MTTIKYIALVFLALLGLLFSCQKPQKTSENTSNICFVKIKYNNKNIESYVDSSLLPLIDDYLPNLTYCANQSSLGEFYSNWYYSLVAAGDTCRPVDFVSFPKTEFDKLGRGINFENSQYGIALSVFVNNLDSQLQYGKIYLNSDSSSFRYYPDRPKLPKNNTFHFSCFIRGENGTANFDTNHILLGSGRQAFWLFTNSVNNTARECQKVNFNYYSSFPKKFGSFSDYGDLKMEISPIIKIPIKNKKGQLIAREFLPIKIHGNTTRYKQIFTKKGNTKYWTLSPINKAPIEINMQYQLFRNRTTGCL